jgi:hypothetical protein
MGQLLYVIFADLKIFETREPSHSVLIFYPEDGNLHGIIRLNKIQPCDG